MLFPLFRKRKQKSSETQQLLDEIAVITQRLDDLKAAQSSIDNNKPQVDDFKMELLSAIETLRSEISKLGKSQLRANTVVEANLNELKQQTKELTHQFRIPSAEGLGTHEIASSLATSGFRIPEGVIADWLLIADGLSEGINAAKNLQTTTINNISGENNHISSWLEGINIVHRRILELLSKWNVQTMNAIGKTFDPHIHIAVGVEHTEAVPENTIVAVQRAGYMRGNDVIRYAEVIVAKQSEYVKSEFVAPAAAQDKYTDMTFSDTVQSEMELLQAEAMATPQKTVERQRQIHPIPREPRVRRRKDDFLD